MDLLQEGLWYSPVNVSYSFENVQIFYKSIKLNDKCHGKLQGGIDTKSLIPSWDKISKRYLLRLTQIFVIAMIQLNYEGRKCIGDYTVLKSKEKIYERMYVDDI